MTTYRSVKVILQNNSMESLIVTGSEAITGSWTAAPTVGDIVSPNGSDTWAVASTDINSGCGAYITMITSNGYVILSWQLPLMGPLEYEVRHPNGYQVRFQIYNEAPEAPVLLIYLWGNEQYEMEFGCNKSNKAVSKTLTTNGSTKEIASSEVVAETTGVGLDLKGEKKRS